MPSIAPVTVTFVVLVLLCHTVNCQNITTIQTIINRMCVLNKNTDAWSSVSDCDAYAADPYSIDTSTVPGCMFRIKAPPYAITADPQMDWSCAWNDPLVLPEEVALFTELNSLMLFGPQPELSGKNFSGLSTLQILGYNNVSFTSEPVWPEIAQMNYVNQTNSVALPPMTNDTDGRLKFSNSVYHGSTITTQVRYVVISDSVFPLGVEIISTNSVVGYVSLTDVVVGNLSITSSRTAILTRVAINGDVTISTSVTQLSAVTCETLVVDSQALVMNGVFTDNITINSDIRYVGINNSTGRLSSELVFTDQLISMVIDASPQLEGKVVFPDILAPIPTYTVDPIIGLAINSNTIMARNTLLTGLVTFPQRLSMITISDSKFTGKIPDVESYPSTLVFIDLRNNYLDLCNGYPSMGPKIPQTVASGNVLIYPQHANVTCYCIAGNCLSGNGFPAHYQGTPAIYQSSDCISTAPVEGTFCLIGFWSIVGNYTVQGGESLTAGTGLAVQGDLTLHTGGTITYDLSENPVLVQGTLTVQPSSTITVNLNDDHLSDLRGKHDKINVTVPLIRSDGLVIGDASSMLYSHNLPSDSCNKITDSSLTVVRGSLAAIMTVDGNKCKGPAQWSKGTIVGVTVGISAGLVVVVTIVALLATFNTTCRRAIRPFTARNERKAEGNLQKV